jgi:hypothetical protein
MRQHAEEKPHICTVCIDFFFLFFMIMNIVINLIQSFHVKVCNKVLNCQNDLNEHMKQHTNPKPYKCDVS